MAEQVYSNNPLEVVDRYIFTDFHYPVPSNIEAAARIIKEKYPERDAFGICIDIGANPSFMMESADILAVMFHEKHPSLPEHWRQNPEIMRTVVSMAATIDLGFLQAQSLHQESDGVNPHLERRIGRLKFFLSELQAKTNV